MDDIMKSIGKLRRDAIERQMSDLAIAYGWSEIRMGEEKLGRQMTDLERYRMARG